MYQLLFNGYPIYDPRDDSLCIRDVDTHLAVGEAGSMSFVLDHDHPYAGKLTRLTGRLELLADGVTIWRGRILSDTQGFYLERTIEAEGQLACLNDSIVQPFEFPGDYAEDADYQAAAESGNVVEFWLGKLLDSHNSQVTEEQQILLGDVTVTDPNNYVARSSTDYATTWATITDKLSGSSLGGHLLVRYASDGSTYLDYLDDFPLSNTQEVVYAENLLDLFDGLDAMEIYTAILPVGAEGLTIAELNNEDLTDDLVKDGKIIYSKSGVAKYGRITSVQTWDDVTEAANLRSKASARLSGTGVLTTRTITITAADLGGLAPIQGNSTDTSAVAGTAVAGVAIIGTDSSAQSVSESNTAEAVAHFMVGRYVRLKSGPHGLETSYPLMELEPDILDPGNTRITLGATIKTATDIAHDNQSATQEALDKHQMALDKQDSSITDLAQSTDTKITEAIQTCESIILSALDSYVETSNFEEYKDTVSSQLSILADQIELKFTQATEQIQTVDGDLQSKYSEITKYFRFTVDGLVVGEEGNQITLRVDNDRISFLDGGLEVAYISNKQLYITDAHFLNSLRIGKFAWVPRKSGNLSLVRVGD